MYLHQKPQLHLQPFNFHKQEHHCSPTTMMIEVTSNPTTLPPPSHHHHHHQILLIDTTSSGGEDNTITNPNNNNNNNNPENIKAPKKRAETWVQEETRTLISLRRESDSLFNTSKSNKHLWDQISGKMREKGFDRSPTMCTDKWRNLLKEFKKAKQHQDRGGGNGSAKMSYYKEIEEILRDRSKNGAHYKTSPGSKVDSFMQFSDKGIDDTSITFGPVEAVFGAMYPFGWTNVSEILQNDQFPSPLSNEPLRLGRQLLANGRATLNLESRLDHEGHPLAITAADTVTASGVSPWNWRETPGNGDQSNSFGGRVISVKLGDYTRRIGIDGTPDAIKEAIKSAFRLRTKRAFWLEDEDNVVRTLDRDMPLGNYILHVDEGLTIKVCLYEEPDNMPVHTEDKTFYTEDDFRDFLSRRGWTCLREYTGYRNVDSMDELCPGAIYRGIS